MNKLFKKFRRIKNKGSILFLTIVLSGLIVTIGLGLARLLATEIQFSADLLFTEKSYFAAESGIEISLLELKVEPTQNLRNEFLLGTDGSTKIQLDIQNLKEDSFSFSVDPQQTTKLRLEKDLNPGELFEEESVSGFDIKIEDAPVHWKFLCTNGEGKTVALQGTMETGIYMNFYGSKTGNYDDPMGNTTEGKTFADIQSEESIEAKNCFFSLTNLSETKSSVVTFSNTQIPPPHATIHSIGISGGRQKSILFEYSQKNLSSFFDFGLFHSE